MEQRGAVASRPLAPIAGQHQQQAAQAGRAGRAPEDLCDQDSTSEKHWHSCLGLIMQGGACRLLWPSVLASSNATSAASSAVAKAASSMGLDGAVWGI